MAIIQAIWSLEDKKELQTSSLINENELEDMIAENISLLSDEWLIVGRQVRTLYGGEIDLLCIDIGGNLIVVELKKNKTPREVTAQALDYASWVNDIDTEELAEIYLRHTKGEKSLDDAFFERFGTKLIENIDDTDTQIVIVATGMDGSTERIIKYLKGFGLDISVLFFNIFEHEGKRLLSRAWIIESEQMVSSQKTNMSKSWNGEHYFSFGDDDSRSWEDAVKYSFVSAGGGAWYTNTMRKLEIGSRLWVNIPGVGYVGVGIVTETATSTHESEISVDGQDVKFFDLPLNAEYHKDSPSNKGEYIVRVKWLKTAAKNEAVREFGFFGNQNTVARPVADKWDFTVNRLKEIWGIED